jgi:hypothetical protein
MIQLSAILVLALVWLIYRHFSRWPLDVIGLACAMFVLFYGFRAVVVAFGLDPLSPDYLFGLSGPSAAIRANLVLSLFLAALIAGLALSSLGGLAFPRWTFPSIERHPSGSRYLTLTVGLTALGAVITLALFDRFGGFSGLLQAAKFEKELGGITFLRIVPSVAAVVAVSSALDVIRLRRCRLTPARRQRLVISVICALLNGYFIFAWGARSILAIVTFCLLTGTLAFWGEAAARFRRTSLRIWIGLAIAVVVGATGVVGLRFYRDTTVTGELTAELRDATGLRQLSLASNSTSYDAFVLAVRDWPDTFTFRGGEDFVVGAQTVVPRFLLPGRAESPSVGAWFRRVYEPDTANGWPLQSVGEWYLNFGVPGVVFGGLLSGVLLGMASAALRSSRWHPLAFAIGAVVAFRVLSTGVNVETPLWWARWVIPLVLVTAYLRAGPSWSNVRMRMRRHDDETRTSAEHRPGDDEESLPGVPTLTVAAVRPVRAASPTMPR